MDGPGLRGSGRKGCTATMNVSTASVKGSDADINGGKPARLDYPPRAGFESLTSSVSAPPKTDDRPPKMDMVGDTC